MCVDMRFPAYKMDAKRNGSTVLPFTAPFSTNAVERKAKTE